MAFHKPWSTLVWTFATLLEQVRGTAAKWVSESFAVVVDGFTSGTGSFKFSRSVLKILKLFLEMSDDTGEQGGEVIPRRGE
jgi:hypothetical protein